MKRALFLVGVLAASFVNAEDKCPLVGKWRSDEARTLESMRMHGNVTEKQRELFENAFFGRLTVDIECDKFIATFDGEEGEAVTFEIVAVEGRAITMRYVESFTGSTIESTATIENDGCYSVPVGSVGFKEYFCKIE